jgi:DNA-binding MarR family transcriptional regulator
MRPAWAIGSGSSRIEATDFTVSEWVFMRALRDVDRHPLSALAEQMGMTRGAITKLADRLIAKGFVNRTANSDDKRAQTLSLTAAETTKVPGPGCARLIPTIVDYRLNYDLLSARREQRRSLIIPIRMAALGR